MYFVLRIPPGPLSFVNLAYKSNVSDTQFYKCWTVCVSYNVFKLLPFSSNVEFPKKSDNFRTVPNTFQQLLNITKDSRKCSDDVWGLPNVAVGTILPRSHLSWWDSRGKVSWNLQMVAKASAENADHLLARQNTLCACIAKWFSPRGRGGGGYIG